jgi:hypothetical protein
MTRHLPTTLVTACALLGVSAANAQERVPPTLALRVLLRVLTYDKNLASHGQGDFVVLIVYEPGQNTAFAEATAAAAAMKGMSLAKRPLRFADVELRDPSALAEAASKASANALLLLPGLSRAGEDAAVSVAKSTGCYTLSLDPRLVERSFLIGVSYKDGRPQLILNIAAAKTAHADFDVAILKLARIIK